MTRPQAPLSYRDIKQIVLERIQNGTWPPDSFLPNEAELTDQFSSTRTTVNRALRELAEEGYLERRRKAGTRVLAAPVRQARFAIPLVREEVEQAGAAYRYALVARRVIPAPTWLSGRLDLTPNQRVLHLECMHYADNAPFQYEVRWIVADTIPEALKADFTDIGPNEWLVQRVPLTNLELSFTATKADSTIAQFLETTAGEPVFLAERTTWLKAAPVTLARMYFAPGYRMTTRI